MLNKNLLSKFLFNAVILISKILLNSRTSLCLQMSLRHSSVNQVMNESILATTNKTIPVHDYGKHISSAMKFIAPDMFLNDHAALLHATTPHLLRYPTPSWTSMYVQSPWTKKFRQEKTSHGRRYQQYAGAVRLTTWEQFYCTIDDPTTPIP